MLALKHCGLLTLLATIVIINGDDVDEDYYFESTFLRSLDYGDCGGEVLEVLCALKCPKRHVCINKQCLCVDHIVRGNKAANDKIKKNITNRAKKDLKDIHKRADDRHNPPGFVDFTIKEEYEEKPALRHHIAHFCPNLDVARTCIQKCMKVGKPAFCGKDHVCYCGHRYNKQTKDKSLDSHSVYAQFKDLYKKYFGDKYDPHSSDEM